MGDLDLVGDPGRCDLGVEVVGASDFRSNLRGDPRTGECVAAVTVGSFCGDCDLDLDLSRSFFNKALLFSGGLSGGDDSR